MMEGNAEASPGPRARITGGVYLLYFLTAIFAETVLAPRRHVGAYVGVNLVAYAFYITVTLLFYFMFKPVDRSISLLAALFSLAGCANELLRLFHVNPYKINSLVFFGPYCLLIGYLIFRSTFLPRILGVLMMLAGVGWLMFLSPLASHLTAYLKVLGFVAELSLCLWLLVKGVNVVGWNAQSSAVERRQ
jgi:hypothetical protein